MSQNPRLDYNELIGQLLEANWATPAHVLDWLINDLRTRPGQPGQPDSSGDQLQPRQTTHAGQDATASRHASGRLAQQSVTPNKKYRGKNPERKGPVKTSVITPRETARGWIKGEIPQGLSREADLHMKRVKGMMESTLRARMKWPGNNSERNVELFDLHTLLKNRRVETELRMEQQKSDPSHGLTAQRRAQYERGKFSCGQRGNSSVSRTT